MNANNFIITGGGGSGKTSLINYLQSIGYSTHPEVSRIIIQEQQNIAGSLIPWKDLYGFGLECLTRMNQQLHDNKNGITFFDRGIPDIFAYFQTQNLELPKTNINLHGKYNKTVFICPPWKDIFTNDSQRPESFEFSSTIYLNLKVIYVKLGFTLVELPKKSISERADFLINHLVNTAYFKGRSKTLPSLAK